MKVRLGHLEYLEVAGQYQVLDTLKQRVEELKEIEQGMKRKYDFYEYMKDEAKVEEKRNKIKSIPSLNETLNLQKPIITEKSRLLVNQIKQISKSMVKFFHQTTFNAMNSKLGHQMSSDFVSTDSITKVPLEDFKRNLSRLVSQCKYQNAQPTLVRQGSQTKYALHSGVQGNRIPNMARLQTETLQDSDVGLLD